jgi:hypothetical protein
MGSKDTSLDEWNKVPVISFDECVSFASFQADKNYSETLFRQELVSEQSHPVRTRRVYKNG